jgi:ribulose-5-phosphate 4-epimerase/fuculose-1-phosphate aldolase
MVHTHSPYASTFAVLGQPIPACLTASAMLGGEIPLGGYAPIGGADIGQEIIDKIGRSLAIVMQNHGVFTIGSSPQQATRWFEVRNRSDYASRDAAWETHSTHAGPDRLHGGLISNQYGQR